jgi:hypothetical protein
LIAVDYEARKYHNLLTDDGVASSWTHKPGRGIRGVLVRGKSKILETSSEFREAYVLSHKGFSWVRADSWKEGEAPFVKIEPTYKSSW